MTHGLIVACVCTGDQYGNEYVDRLAAGVARHSTLDYEFVVLTDAPARFTKYRTIDIGRSLPGWWGKMALFKHEWRAGCQTVYLDLDTTVAGDLDPLLKWRGDFGICANFTRRGGHKNWPCRYGSCVMSLGPDWGRFVWPVFSSRREILMDICTRGDQQAIEVIAPNATFLQDELSDGFFMSYRDLHKHNERPHGCSLLIFGGRKRPDNYGPAWARKAWHGK